MKKLRKVPSGAKLATYFRRRGFYSDKSSRGVLHDSKGNTIFIKGTLLKVDFIKPRKLSLQCNFKLLYDLNLVLRQLPEFHTTVFSTSSTNYAYCKAIANDIKRLGDKIAIYNDNLLELLRDSYKEGSVKRILLTMLMDEYQEGKYELLSMFIYLCCLPAQSKPVLRLCMCRKIKGLDYSIHGAMELYGLTWRPAPRYLDQVLQLLGLPKYDRKLLKYSPKVTGLKGRVDLERRDSVPSWLNELSEKTELQEQSEEVNKVDNPTETTSESSFNPVINSSGFFDGGLQHLMTTVTGTIDGVQKRLIDHVGIRLRSNQLIFFTDDISQLKIELSKLELSDLDYHLELNGTLCEDVVLLI